MLIEDHNDLPSDARVWIYQADRIMTRNEVEIVTNRLTAFCKGWSSHGAEVKSGFEIQHSLFIFIYGVEPGDGVSGCSIDSSVTVLRALESEIGVRLFDRQTVAWELNEELMLSPMHEFWALRKAGKIDDNTIVFDNLVKTLSERQNKWRTAFSSSWHASMW